MNHVQKGHTSTRHHFDINGLLTLKARRRQRTNDKIVSSGAERGYPRSTTMDSSGREREYVLYVPWSYDRAKPTPLIITMHGALLGPAAQMGISQWNRVADKHGFIVVYPARLTSGVGLACPSGLWSRKPF